MSKPDKTCPECGTQYHGAAVFCQKEGATLVAYVEPSDPLVGTTLLDQFRIDAVIGRGGMGQVYRARQTTLGRDVAIKVLHRDLVKNRDATRRFQQEARVATSIAHEHLVQVYLFGQLPDGSLYLVMELLEGRSLAEVLRDDGQLPLERALRIAYDTAMAVGAAHAKGIIHRDIKPENVMMVTRGGDPDFAKVLDFGIAKVLHDAAGEKANRLTQSGVIFGTARYISPEGAAGEDADARSDVYSMAVLTYQLLCHEPPFDAKAPVALLMKHLHDKPPHIRKRRGGAHVPPAVADVVMRALNKNPEARHDNATEFARALERAAASVGVHFVGGAARHAAEPDPRSSKTLVEAAGNTPAKGPARPRPGMATELQGSPLIAGTTASEGFAHGAPAAPPTEAGYLSNPGAQAEAPYSPRPIAARIAMPVSPMPSDVGPTGHAPVPHPAPVQVPPAPGFSTQEAMAAAPSAYRASGDTAMMHVPGIGSRASGRLGLFAAIAVAAALMIGAGGFFMHLRSQAAEAEQLEGLEARAREALSHGAIDTPPGENVTALTNRILERSPHHQGARALRREAALLLREQAANARSRGNLDEARSAYARVLALFPDDPAAEHGLEALGSATGSGPSTPGGAAGLSGTGLPPGVHLEPQAPVARQPTRLVGVFGPELTLPDDVLPEFTIFRGGRRVDRTAARRGGVSGTWVADYTFTRSGAYEVTLEFGVGAQRVMLRQAVDVGAASRAPRRGRRPAVARPRQSAQGMSNNTPLPPPPGGGFRPLGPPMQAAPITGTATPGGMRASDGEVDWSAMPVEPPPPWTGE